MVSPLVGSSEDIRPIPVRTLRVRANTLRTAAIGSEPAPAPAVIDSAPPEAVAVAPPTSARPGGDAAAPVTPVLAETAPAPAPIPAAAQAPPAPAPVVEAAPAPPTPVQRVTDTREAAATCRRCRSPPRQRPRPPLKLRNRRRSSLLNSTQSRGSREGWVIQVGALETVGQAKERLGSAKSSAASILKRADPFTEKVVKGDKTLYRARFSGLDKGQAEAACRALKRSDIPCMLVVAGNRNQ